MIHSLRTTNTDERTNERTYQLITESKKYFCVMEIVNKLQRVTSFPFLLNDDYYTSTNNQRVFRMDEIRTISFLFILSKMENNKKHKSSFRT